MSEPTEMAHPRGNPPAAAAAPAFVPPTLAVHLTDDDLRHGLEQDVRNGLTATPKQLPPVYFYDDRGSQLFEEITRLPEYYPTRAERSILDAHAKDMALLSEADTLIELGAGTCEKSRVLLDALQATGRLAGYVPLDVSATTLWTAANALAREYPGLQVNAVVGDFHRHLDQLPTGGRRLFAFLGGTIGNLEPAQRRRFLLDLDCVMDAGDRFVLGTDLVKDPARLIAAYDDAAGVTAEFNRNVLQVLNRELGADFDPSEFEHVAKWNQGEHRIEMWLRATRAQSIHIADLDLDISFAAGEEMLTEISTKFTPEALEAELVDCGFVIDATWTSDGDEFLMTLCHPYC
ncbi:MAG TPA: L-histidine N(alpha)-methyltransferase [Acidimicrobiales bacterium]|nr:L-histidine N(alpha)-methyltransferase [Acidimicrobiales bacterium]